MTNIKVILINKLNEAEKKLTDKDKKLQPEISKLIDMVQDSPNIMFSLKDGDEIHIRKYESDFCTDCVEAILIDTTTRKMTK